MLRRTQDKTCSQNYMLNGESRLEPRSQWEQNPYCQAVLLGSALEQDHDAIAFLASLVRGWQEKWLRAVWVGAERRRSHWGSGTLSFCWTRASTARWRQGLNQAPVEISDAALTTCWSFDIFSHFLFMEKCVANDREPSL